LEKKADNIDSDNDCAAEDDVQVCENNDLALEGAWELEGSLKAVVAEHD
jgi:hypothetical protein